MKEVRDKVEPETEDAVKLFDEYRQRLAEVIDITTINRQIARPFPGSTDQRDAGKEDPAQVKNPKEDDQQERQHECKFEQRLTRICFWCFVVFIKHPQDILFMKKYQPSRVGFATSSMMAPLSVKRYATNFRHRFNAPRVIIYWIEVLTMD